MKNRPALVLAAALVTVMTFPLARPAQADTASTVAIAAAAAAIVGTLLVDSNKQTYYVKNGKHVYVNKSTADYYRAHGNRGGRQQGGGQRGGQMMQHNQGGGMGR